MTPVIVDQSDWIQISVTGADRIRFLQGMCTGNIETLAAGQWLMTAMLTPKGRVLAVFEVVARDESLLLLCEPELADKIAETLDSHAIMDDVEFARSGGPMHRVWTDPASVWTAEPVFAPPPEPADAEAVRVRRMEAGLPCYGVDVGEDNFPFESPLVRLVDYDKGCFVGQEPVARVRSRGQPQKQLRALLVAGEALPEPGQAVVGSGGEPVGAVTSAARSPDHGVIALAYLSRAGWEVGGQVSVGGATARVAGLPLE